ncbi:MAG: double-strand break repair helicase AddA [Parvibaculum sp.]|uniref:double-strand break repair helicase AddA n=1 Tax=Parvibaculum sp. TaxID=2024848 RepID=UPI002600A43B|nr:double-strand break repair helicase AddA [Parvibaculum sp.]MCE9650050.1 double-strand break repair helicase AddA [Parvibaculum sp.]
MTATSGRSGAPEQKRQPTADDAQARASNPVASVWVSANAGSGKTHALTTRVTRLLLAGTEPERILCLTFTKAAAAEMASRLYQRLGDWAMASDEELARDIAKIEGPMPDKAKLTRARRLFARAIETPGGLKIQTIHAFCERLLGRFPLEAKVPPNFDILDERRAAELLQEVRDEVLGRARAEGESPLGRALSHVVGRIDETVFDKLMHEITGKRANFSRLTAHYGGVDGVAAAIRVALGVAPGETVESARDALFAAPEFPQAGLRGALEALRGGTPTDQKQADKLGAVLEARDRSGQRETYLEIFLTGTGEPRKNVLTKGQSAKHPAAAGALAEEQARVVAHVTRLKSVQVAEASEAILRLADEILKGFADAKRRRAYLDYEDLIARTRELLMTSAMAPWVLYKLDGGIDHILVDEAQDTSPDQWDVISELTVEFLSGAGARGTARTIFAVGDEKQSIFSFQGADPQRFDDMRRHFEQRVKAAELTWDPVRLVRSFRSVPEVLKAVDAVFAQAGGGLTASGVVDEHIAVRDLDAGLVELWDLERPDEKAEADPWDAPLDYMNEADPRARLAERIALTIEGWLDDGEMLTAKGRPIRPGDILILVRRRDAFVTEMIRKLKTKKIPVAGADRMVLTDEIAVMDLMALGRFVLLPDDDLTLATLLKSPLVGLDEDELFKLAWSRKGGLWRELRRQAEENGRFKAALDLLTRLLDRADYEPPYEFFAHVLGEERGRQKLLARLGADAADPIDEFLNLALDFERDHAVSMQSFLHWAERGGAEIKRDMDKGRDEVRIMTVHGAKGLEAEIVFMPDTCSAPAAQHDPGLIALPTEPPLLLWPVRKRDEDAATGAARDIHRRAQAEEYRRLLYVAMTRARDRLYVCGYQGAREPAPDCWYNLIADALKPLAQEITLDETHTIWRIAGEQRRAVMVEERAPEADRRALPGWADANAAPEPTPSRPLAPSRLPPEGLPEPAALSPLEGDRSERFLRGRLIHRLLQTLPDVADAAREAAAMRFLESPAYKLDGAARAEIAAATLAVLRDPGFADIFAEGSRAEAALVGHITFAGKPTLVSGQIDRLCVTPDRVIVVDYKTNRPAPEGLGGVSPAYLAQMAAYRALLGQIYPDREIACALLWTDGPRLMELPSRALDAALAGRSVNLDLPGAGS